MASLSPLSTHALSRLRAYAPPPSTIYESLPTSRRAAVLILLFAGSQGELRVVLTVRAESLSSFPGQVALPGGKASSASETPLSTALREAHEEIGLPLSPPPQHLCQLPANLSNTNLCVLPSVAFLSTSPLPRWIPNPLEVSAVFDYPLNAFLHKTPLEEGGRMWYQGSWISWHAGEHWRMHKFYVPTLDDDEAQHYKVWGMTARMLVDAARIAYDQEPEFEHMTTLGDEVLIGRLVREGVMGEKGASALGDEEGRGRVEEGEEGVHRTSIGAKI